jgi:hypothetical protein
MWKRISRTAIAIFISANFASAQSARFSGAWDSQTNPGLAWNIDQSDVGVKVTITPPSKQVRTIEWQFDGPPVADVITGFSAQTVARMDGQFLSFSGPIVLKDPSNPASVQVTWRLSPNGDELTVDTTITVTASLTTMSRQQTFHRRK